MAIKEDPELLYLRWKVRKLEAENLLLKRAALDRQKTMYGGDPLLDLAPFRMWLIYKSEAYESTKALATALGLAERRVRAYMLGYEWDQRSPSPKWCGPRPLVSVTLASVDKALTNEGSITLSDLYPHIPGWDD